MEFIFGPGKSWKIKVVFDGLYSYCRCQSKENIWWWRVVKQPKKLILVNTRVRVCWTLKRLWKISIVTAKPKVMVNFEKVMEKRYEPCNSVDTKKSKKDCNTKIFALDDWTYNDSEFHISSNARRVQTPQVGVRGQLCTDWLTCYWELCSVFWSPGIVDNVSSIPMMLRCQGRIGLFLNA